ncbi:MAG: chondroitinase-B domain-containing protein [Ferruginibacter sp.]
MNCTGTKEQPITFKAQDAGKVIISGHSQLKLGGNFIVVDGFYFTMAMQAMVQLLILE